MLLQDHSVTVFLKITIHSHIKHYYDGYYSKNFMSAARVQQIMTIGHINIKECMR